MEGNQSCCLSGITHLPGRKSFSSQGTREVTGFLLSILCRSLGAMANPGISRWETAESQDNPPVGITHWFCHRCFPKYSVHLRYWLSALWKRSNKTINCSSLWSDPHYLVRIQSHLLCHTTQRKLLFLASILDL